MWRMSSQEVAAIDEGYPIAEVIEDVRDELLSAQRKWNKEGGMPLFELQHFDLELAFVVRRTESASAEANFELIAVGGESQVNQERVQRIKLHMTALQAKDVSVESASGAGTGGSSDVVRTVVTPRKTDQ
jgi:hypothetical protein